MKYLILFFIGQSLFAYECGTIEALRKSTVMIDGLGNYRLWSDLDRQELTYCISNRFKELKPKMIKVMEIATSDWMSGGNFQFRYVPEADETCDHRKGPKTRFRIAINTSRRYPYAGRAFFPYDERVTVTLKKTYVEKDMDEILRLTRHELGHVLGLRHEHIRYENPRREQCQEDDNFDAVTDYDSSSIMHYSRCGGIGGMELSEADLLGVGKLYPY